MKRTYSRLSSEILRFDTEVGFMSASIVEKPVDDVTTSGHEVVTIDLGGQDWNDGKWED